MKIWNYNKNKYIINLKVHEMFPLIFYLEYKNKKYIASSGNEKSIKIWKLSNHEFEIYKIK